VRRRPSLGAEDGKPPAKQPRRPKRTAEEIARDKAVKVGAGRPCNTDPLSCCLPGVTAAVFCVFVWHRSKRSWTGRRCEPPPPRRMRCSRQGGSPQHCPRQAADALLAWAAPALRCVTGPLPGTLLSPAYGSRAAQVKLLVDSALMSSGADGTSLGVKLLGGCWLGKCWLAGRCGRSQLLLLVGGAQGQVSAPACCFSLFRQASSCAGSLLLFQPLTAPSHTH
jgi:hypothetical protein